MTGAMTWLKSVFLQIMCFPGNIITENKDLAGMTMLSHSDRTIFSGTILGNMLGNPGMDSYMNT